MRGALAARRREIAALEHASLERASIASFARLSLELLALGVPPALLAGAQQAAMVEIAHARAALGPGSLDVTGVAPATSARPSWRRWSRTSTGGGGARRAFVARETRARPVAGPARRAPAESDRSAHDLFQHRKMFVVARLRQV
ncbi:hypothetical protein WMF30_07650 [Sorangium sp. So ce134]